VFLVTVEYGSGVVFVLRDLRIKRAVLLSHFLVVLMAMSSCWVLNIGHLLLTELCVSWAWSSLQLLHFGGLVHFS